MKSTVSARALLVEFELETDIGGIIQLYDADIIAFRDWLNARTIIVD